MKECHFQRQAATPSDSQGRFSKQLRAYQAIHRLSYVQNPDHAKDSCYAMQHVRALAEACRFGGLQCTCSIESKPWLRSCPVPVQPHQEQMTHADTSAPNASAVWSESRMESEKG